MLHSSPIRRKTQPTACSLSRPLPDECETPKSGDESRAAIPDSEQGYIMLVAIFLLAILVLSLAVAAPQVAKSIQRDREVETYHRGMQYRRAIQLYYRKFHAYPPNADALVKTNEIRFLRKQYIDPITGKNDWKPVLFGQNKVPTALGFFGQPLAGNATTIAGVGPSGGLTSGLPTGSGGFSLSGGAFSSPTGSYGDQGTSSGTSGTPTGAPGAAGGTGSTGSSDSGTGSSTGQTFGGAGIIGFEPAPDKKSILIYKKKQKYNEWEFTYDPISDMQTIAGGNAGAIGQPVGNGGTGGGIGGTGGGIGGTGGGMGGTGGGFGGGTGSYGGNGGSSTPNQ